VNFRRVHRLAPGLLEIHIITRAPGGASMNIYVQANVPPFIFTDISTSIRWLPLRKIWAG